MTGLFRTLVLAALLAVLAAMLVPLDHPIAVTLRFDRPLPPWAIAAMATLPLGLLLLVAAAGLLAFRRWARWLGALVAMGGLGVASLVAGSPLAAALNHAAMVLLVLALLAWLAALAACLRPAVATRFGRGRGHRVAADTAPGGGPALRRRAARGKDAASR